MTPILRTHGLTHQYSIGTPFQNTAIEDICLSIPKGQFVGLIGHTGSGKSTLIQHLNGLLSPTSGTVYYEDADIFASKETVRNIKFKVGLVFQYPEHQLFEETVYKDIAFGPKNQKLTEEEVDQRVREAARFVGVEEELFEKSPLDLSGGQKRRVAIAGVIAMRPGVLVLDEPTAGLDPEARDSLFQNIEEYRKAAGSTVILVTHSMDDIARIADRLIVMNAGHVVMDGTPEEIFSRADELTSIGLSVPIPTKIAMELRRRGVEIPDAIYTTPYLRKAVLNLFTQSESQEAYGQGGEMSC